MSEFERSTSSQELDTRQSILVIQNITLNALLFVALGVILAIQTRSWQAYQFIILATMVLICGFVSIAMVRRGRPKLGVGLFFIIDLIAPIWASLLVSNLGYVALAYILVTSYFMITYALPKNTRYIAMALSIVGLIITIFVETIAPTWRLVSEMMLIVSILSTGLLAAIFIGVITWQMWHSGRLRNKIIVMMVGTLAPVLIISTYFSVQAQRQDLESLLLERAEGLATSGALTIGHLLEDAIESGALTYEQVFDRNYAKFWEFDPANDPNYDPETEPDTSALDKYHTAYDAYTDEHWQELLDSYVTGEDVLFAVPVDINGYLPTHNSQYTTGDGSAATDRTKRIFDDPVGIKSARNTEPVLQQVYTRSGTGETLWDVSAPVYVNGEHWGGFRVGIQLGENTSRIVTTTWRLIFSGIIVLAAVVTFAWFLGNYVSAPIERLTRMATQASEGNLDQQITITNRDEITLLADAFNSMITQLRDLVTSLEQRIAARTRALETSTEVSRQLSTILDQRDLVREVVEQVQSAFNYYHAQIYLFDEDKENLQMVGGTGEAGHVMLEQKHSIPKGRGIVGQVADTNLPLRIPNVDRAIGIEIVTAATIEDIYKRESSVAATRAWYANRISERFTDIQTFSAHVAQKKRAGEHIPSLGFILYGTNQFWKQVKIGAESAAESFGIDLAIESADGDADKGLNIFHQMVAQKKDGIIVAPHVPERWVTPILQAVEAGIPVLTVNLRCPDAPISAWFGQDGYQSGLVLGREIQKALMAAGMTEGEILVGSARRFQELQERYEGLQHGLAGSAFTLSEFYGVGHEKQENYAAWEKLIQSHPDIVAAVGLVSTDLPNLIELKRRSNAEWVIGGYDQDIETLDGIREGLAQVSICQHPYLQGYLPILALSQHLIDGMPLKNWIVENWQANPLLPQTRAEVAVPIAIGENVLGVLDIQDDQVEGLTEEDVSLLQSIANQVAIALQNAQAYQRTQQQVAREALIANINQQIQSTTEVEEALQVAVRELGRALGTKTGIQLTDLNKKKERN